MRALAVIPTYDERASLGRVIDDALAAAERADLALDILVVDDNSPDGTGALADDYAKRHRQVEVLHRPKKAGLGPAYRAGFAWGMQRDYDALCEMDADHSHDPVDLPRLVAALGGADVVIGSRYVPGGGVVDWPKSRLALSRGGNRYVQLMTGIGVADATSGFRAYRRSTLEILDVSALKSDGYSFQLELALRAWQSGLRIVEVPITFTERQAGASKISRRIVVEALIRVARWGMSGNRHPVPQHPGSVTAQPLTPPTA